MGFAEDLRYILDYEKMTIKDLADKSGVSANTLYQALQRDSLTAKPEIEESIYNALGLTRMGLKDSYMLKMQKEPDETPMTKEQLMVSEVASKIASELYDDMLKSKKELIEVATSSFREGLRLGMIMSMVTQKTE